VLKPASGESRDGRRRSIARGALPVLCWLLLALGVLEAGLRLRGYDPLAPLRREGGGLGVPWVERSPNPLRGYELIPGSRGYGFRCRFEIDRHGFRSRDYSLERPADVHRFLVLGDSITFGYGLDAEPPYPDRLERILAERGFRCQVPNLSTSGYDTLQSVAALEDVGLAFEPDLVIVGYCFNDLGTVSGELVQLERIADYASWIYSSRLALWFKLWNRKAELLRDASERNEERRFLADNRGTIADVGDDDDLRARMASIRERLARHTELFASSHPLTWYASEAHVGKLRYSFERLGALSRARGFAVLVAVIPHLDERSLTRVYDLAYAVVEAEARRVGFDVLQLARPLRVAGLQRLRIDRVHPNALGHQLIAEELARHIELAGYLRE